MKSDNVNRKFRIEEKTSDLAPVAFSLLSFLEDDYCTLYPSGATSDDDRTFFGCRSRR